MENVDMPRRRGRPPAFDRAKALESAVKLFRERGYEGASIAELVAAMGISPPSLYGAFGSKEQLYREAVDLYLSSDGAFMLRALSEETTARFAIERILDEAATRFPSAPGQPYAGCMVSTSILTCSPDNGGIAQAMSELRLASLAAIQERIELAAAGGEVPETTNTAALAGFYASILQGMSVQAHDGADSTRLKELAAIAMQCWPT